MEQTVGPTFGEPSQCSGCKSRPLDRTDRSDTHYGAAIENDDEYTFTSDIRLFHQERTLNSPAEHTGVMSGAIDPAINALGMVKRKSTMKAGQGQQNSSN